MIKILQGEVEASPLDIDQGLHLAPADRMLLAVSDTTDRLCAELQGLREALGLSRAAAARRCSPPMTGQQWGQIERGAASTIRQFERCFQALGARLNISVEVPRAE